MCVFVALVIQYAVRMRPVIVLQTARLSEKLLKTKSMFWFSLQPMPEIFFILKKNSERCYLKYTQVFKQITRYSCQILTKLDLSRHIFEKYSNIKFHSTLSSGSRVVPSGRTDMTKLIVVFRNFANVPINVILKALLSPETK